MIWKRIKIKNEIWDTMVVYYLYYFLDNEKGKEEFEKEYKKLVELNGLEDEGNKAVKDNYFWIQKDKISDGLCIFAFVEKVDDKYFAKIDVDYVDSESKEYLKFYIDEFKKLNVKLSCVENENEEKYIKRLKLLGYYCFRVLDAYNKILDTEKKIKRIDKFLYSYSSQSREIDEEYFNEIKNVLKEGETTYLKIKANCWYVRIHLENLYIAINKIGRDKIKNLDEFEILLNKIKKESMYKEELSKFLYESLRDIGTIATGEVSLRTEKTLLKTESKIKDLLNESVELQYAGVVIEFIILLAYSSHIFEFVFGHEVEELPILVKGLACFLFAFLGVLFAEGFKHIIVNNKVHEKIERYHKVITIVSAIGIAIIVGILAYMLISLGGHH